MRYVNYLGHPIDVSAVRLLPEAEKGRRGDVVINQSRSKRDPPSGIIDYTGLERDIELESVQKVRSDWGRFDFLVDGELVVAEYVTLARLGKTHYKITALKSARENHPDSDDEELMALLEKEANRHADWLDLALTDQVLPPEVQYWDDQFTDDGSHQLVFLVNGHEVITDSAPESVKGQIHDLPNRILSSETELPLPALDLLTLMREAVIERITAMSSAVFDDSEDPPF
jgi:hypothetical protein